MSHNIPGRGAGITGSKSTIGPRQVDYHSLSLGEGHAQSPARTGSPGSSHLGNLTGEGGQETPLLQDLNPQTSQAPAVTQMMESACLGLSPTSRWRACCGTGAGATPRQGEPATPLILTSNRMTPSCSMTKGNPELRGRHWGLRMSLDQPRWGVTQHSLMSLKLKERY